MYTQRNSYYSTRKQGSNDSKFEAGKAAELELMKQAGEIKDFKEQVVLELAVNNYIVCTYKIDFVIEHSDGITEYLETKGWADKYWKLKWKLFEAIYSEKPNTKLTVEFQGKKNWKPQRRRIKT